jgi:hypothetical protein
MDAFVLVSGLKAKCGFCGASANIIIETDGRISCACERCLQRLYPGVVPVNLQELRDAGIEFSVPPELYEETEVELRDDELETRRWRPRCLKTDRRDIGNTRFVARVYDSHDPSVTGM